MTGFLSVFLSVIKLAWYVFVCIRTSVCPNQSIQRLQESRLNHDYDRGDKGDNDNDDHRRKEERRKRREKEKRRRERREDEREVHTFKLASLFINWNNGKLNQYFFQTSTKDEKRRERRDRDRDRDKDRDRDRDRERRSRRKKWKLK